MLWNLFEYSFKFEYSRKFEYYFIQIWVNEVCGNFTTWHPHHFELLWVTCIWKKKWEWHKFVAKDKLINLSTMIELF